jgi:hypothetical protein
MVAPYKYPISSTSLAPPHNQVTHTRSQLGNHPPAKMATKHLALAILVLLSTGMVMGARPHQLGYGPGGVGGGGGRDGGGGGRPCQLFIEFFSRSYRKIDPNTIYIVCRTILHFTSSMIVFKSMVELILFLYHYHRFIQGSSCVLSPLCPSNSNGLAITCRLPIFFRRRPPAAKVVPPAHRGSTATPHLLLLSSTMVRRCPQPPSIIDDGHHRTSDNLRPLTQRHHHHPSAMWWCPLCSATTVLHCHCGTLVPPPPLGWPTTGACWTAPVTGFPFI